jgi:diguanylate cyclase (GGDEF)-like protein
MINADNNKVLIVDDEKANIIALTHILSPEYTVYAAKNGKDAVEVAKEHLPDVILLDIVMPEMDGYEVLSILKNEEETREIPVIFVTGLSGSEDEEKGLRLGAADYISKPFRPAVVRLRVLNQIQMLNQINMIRHLSMTDQLTSVPNRRNFDYRLCLEWNHAKRNKTPLAILLIDIDNFKIYNDTHGHLQGDAALQTTAKSITASLRRSSDFIARWGGEEFVVLLPATTIAGALEVAEAARENIEKARIPCVEEGAEKLTASIGVNAITPDHELSMNDFISGADQALYTAKKTGKNKVCRYEGTGLVFEE